ncbi:MAG: bifunctional hydroxymethylpyrimidine kinase/phosphomethylpyrimidine kinase [Planctomycetaceae bacterium]|nr:bifunctional hydroxymethylpyrimidine kinase/phosphomethylpyrimidine kinase [Planctomycetaceae bacterium]
MKHVLTIAGSDSSGGAGIQADLKTMCAFGVFGMSAITAITVQNTQEVRGVMAVPPETVAGQIDAVYDDIRVDAVKVGMVMNAPVATAISDTLARHGAVNIVVDPVMVSKSGCPLIDDDAVQATIRLASRAVLTTPNLREASLLAGMEVTDHTGMEEAARRMRAKGIENVLVKGGGLTEDADDYLLLGDSGMWLRCDRVPTTNLHGAGCSLSSAVACGLAKGRDVHDAVTAAKAFVTQAIRDSLSVGKGVGPLGHLSEVYRRAGVEF